MQVCEYCDRLTVYVKDVDIFHVCVLCLYDEICNNYVVMCYDCNIFCLLHDAHCNHNLELDYNKNTKYLVDKYPILVSYDMEMKMKSLTLMTNSNT